MSCSLLATGWFWEKSLSHHCPIWQHNLSSTLIISGKLPAEIIVQPLISGIKSGTTACLPACQSGLAFLQHCTGSRRATPSLWPSLSWWCFSRWRLNVQLWRGSTGQLCSAAKPTCCSQAQGNGSTRELAPSQGVAGAVVCSHGTKEASPDKEQSLG